MWFFDKTYSRTFESSAEVVTNPLSGFAPSASDVVENTRNSLVYVDVTFRELEPEEGIFAFEQIEQENHLDYWRKAGKHVVFRFVCDYPGVNSHMDIPDWLFEKTGDGVQYDISYGKGYSPNYENEVFIKYHAEAIKALGDYYGKDTFFSYIELGSIGHWGEWHVLYESGISRIPSADIREKYIQPYISAFPNAKILMRRPFETALVHDFGLFNDMAGHQESTTEWLAWIQNGGDYEQAGEKNALVPMKSSWEQAPVGGEFTSAYSMDWMLSVNMAETNKMIASSHTTFLGPNCPEIDGVVSPLIRKGTDETLKNMGYRIGFTKVSLSKPYMSGKTSVEITWNNSGVAPLYWNWPAYLYLLDISGNIIEKTEIDIELSKLLPQKTIKTTTEISFSGKNTTPISVCIGIEDPMTGKPSVFLATNSERIGALSVIYIYNTN